MQSVAKKTVVVTGASAGVGRAIATRFGRAGAKVGLLARDGDALSEVKQEIENLGGTAVVAAVDVSDAEAVFDAADKIVERLGPIDIWINDAMVTVFAPVWDITPAEFRRVTEVTYLGVVHGTMAALRHMRRRGRGTIIQIGSALAYRGIPLQSAYCGSKHAIRGFTDLLRAELIRARSPIRITIMELPAVNTPQFDWARTHMKKRPRPSASVVQPEVIAGNQPSTRHFIRDANIGLAGAPPKSSWGICCCRDFSIAIWPRQPLRRRRRMFRLQPIAKII